MEINDNEEVVLNPTEIEDISPLIPNVTGNSSSTTSSFDYFGALTSDPYLSTSATASNDVAVIDNSDSITMLTQNKVTESPKSLLVLGSSFKTEEQFQPVSAELLTTHTDNNREAVLTSSLSQLKNITTLQDRNIFDSVSVNDPLVMDNDHVVICYQDIYGNEYDKRHVFTASNGQLFSLAYRDDNSSYVPINGKEFTIVKLDKKLSASAYYTYLFNDEIHGEITYRRYTGNIEMIAGVPYGTNIPYYSGLVKTETVKPESVEICTYRNSCRDESGNNIVLKEIHIPELKIEGTNVYPYQNNKIDFANGSYILGNSYASIQDPKSFFENNIKAYSLNSPLQYISEQHYVDSETNKKTSDTYLVIKEHSLFKPVYIYTYNNSGQYEYTPYSVINASSRYSIGCIFNNDNSIRFDLSNGGSHTINYSKINGEYIFKNVDDTLDNYSLNGIQFYKIGNFGLSNYDFYFSISSIIQDEHYNWIEYHKPFVGKNTEDTIINILTISNSGSYLTKLNIEKYSEGYKGVSAIYKGQEVKVYDVYEKEVPEFTYVKYLQEMSTTYNLEYVNYLENVTHYTFDDNLSSIEYKKDILYEREGMTTNYVYYSPRTQAYENYTNLVLEYNNNIYGSSIFDNEEYYGYNFKIVNIYERSKINPDINSTLAYIEKDSCYLTNNAESIVNTYVVEPTIFTNDFEYEFDKYSFVDPVKSYVINVNKQISTLDYDDLPPENWNESDHKFSKDIAYVYYTYINGNEINDNYITVKQYKSNTNVNYLSPQQAIKTIISRYSTIKSTVKIKDIKHDKSKVFYADQINNTITEESTIGDNNLLSSYLALLNSFTQSSSLNNVCSYILNNSYTYLYILTPKTYLVNKFKQYTDINNEELIETSSYNFTKEYFNRSLVYDNGGTYYLGVKNQSYMSVVCDNKTEITYTYSTIITRDGYWKRDFKKNIKPLVTVTYSYASNSIDISNAYIVPTVKNERLGFIHNNKITYNDFVEEVFEDYKYVYYSDKNVQTLFNEDNQNRVIKVGNKFFGLTTKTTDIELSNASFNNGNLEVKKLSTVKQKYIENDEYYKTFYEYIKTNDSLTFINLADSYVEDDEIALASNDETCSSYLYNETANFLAYDYIKDGHLFYASSIDCTNMENLSSFTVDEYINAGGRNLLTYTINTTNLIEVYQRMIADKQKVLKEYVIQEDELIPQYAHIDTPFGLVNGKKVVVTDKIYVPESYMTIVSVDPETYEYTTKRVLQHDAYMAYSYEVEDIPLITATYVFDGGEGGLKIQGMTDLIKTLNNLTIINPSQSGYNSMIIPESSYTVSGDYAYSPHSYYTRIIGSYLYSASKSLVYINEAIDRNTKTLASSISSIDISNNDSSSYINNVANSISLMSKSSNETTTSNVVNLINAQKNMASRISDSINNQTTTLSKVLALTTLSYSSSSSTNASDFLSSLTSTVSRNWQYVSKIGYQTSEEITYTTYKSVPVKNSKIVNKTPRLASTKNVFNNHKYDNPTYISISYTYAFDSNVSSAERIGLHLNKEIREFAYNGYLYKDEYYSYQNIADILSNLQISHRMPTRKEFIIDVSKKLYINSDFIFSYTSPNEYAIRAIRRADILWKELENANIVESIEETKRELPNVNPKFSIGGKPLAYYTAYEYEKITDVYDSRIILDFVYAPRLND